MDVYFVPALVLALVFALLRDSHAQETLVPALITFGDSSVDVGNNNYLPTIFKANYLPYGRDFATRKPTGRFCNGKVISDISAEVMGFKTYVPPYLSPDASGKNLLIGANFASAASGYDDKTAVLHNAIPLSQQLEYFKEYKTKLLKVAGSNKSESIIKDALYLLSTGTADFFQNYYVNRLAKKTYTRDQYGSYLVSAFSRFVKELYSLGARKLGVSLLPPLGCAPEARVSLGYRQEGCVPSLNNDAQNVNKKLNLTAAALRRQLPGLKIVVFDIYKPLYDLVTSPSSFGFVEARRGCCGTGTKGQMLVLCNPESHKICPNASEYVFWDNVHPSEAANLILADVIIVQGVSLMG